MSTTSAPERALSRCRFTALLLRRCPSFAVAGQLNTVTIGSSQWNQTGTECGASIGSTVVIQTIGSALSLLLMYASVAMSGLRSGGAINGPNRFWQWGPQLERRCGPR